MNTAFPMTLVVDSKRESREILEHGLKNRGFDVRSVADASTAVKFITDLRPEAIVLELMLPGIDGMFLISSIRRLTDVPIVVVTERPQRRETIEALARGADDVLSKPVEFEELAARLHAYMRRPHLEMHEIVIYSDVAIDVTRRVATRSGRPLRLTTTEFELLVTLARRPAQVYTRSQLLDLVWGIDRAVTPASVEAYVSHLRLKLNVAGSPPLIHTMRGIGYSLRSLKAS